MAIVTIDISAMREMIDGLSVAKDKVLDFGERLKRKWNTASMTARLGVVSVSWSVIETAWLWFDKQKTMLQTRLDLAMLIAYGTLTFTPGMDADGRDQVIVMDTDIEAFERGRDYAQKMRDGVMTDAEWDEVIAAAGSGDSNFAAGLYSRVSPQDVAQVVRQFLSTHSGIIDPTSIDALGSLLGLASCEGPGLPAGYAEQIVDLMKDNPSLLPAAMSLILEHGEYGTDFALTIAEGLYEYERSDGFPGWDHAGLHYFPELHADAMTGVMAMLASNPEASLKFLTDGETAGDGSVADGETAGDGSVADVEKIQYLFTTRDWETGYANVVSVWSSAIQAAGGPADLSHADQNTWMQTASVSTAVLTALQDNHGFNSAAVDGQARLELATTLAMLLPQMVASACGDGMGCANPESDPYGMAVFYGTGQQWPVVNPRQMRAYLGLMGLAGATPDGALVLAQASQNTQAQILAIIQQAAQGGNVNMGVRSMDEFAQDGIRQIVQVQGWIDGSGTGYTIGQAMQEDQHIRNTIGGVTTGAGAVFTVVGFFPGAGTVIGGAGGAVVTAADVIGVDDAIGDGLATYYGAALQEGTQDQQAAVTGVQNELLPGLAAQLHEWDIRFDNTDIVSHTSDYTHGYEAASDGASNWAMWPR